MICATTCTLPKGENVFLGSRFFVQCCVFDKREQETDMGNSCWTDILSRRGICVDDFSLSTPAYGIAGFGDFGVAFVAWADCRPATLALGSTSLMLWLQISDVKRQAHCFIRDSSEL